MVDKNPVGILLWAVLCVMRVTSGLDLRECNRALGLESGTIRNDQLSASSSFDDLSTGPQNARVRTHDGSGAWCPLHQINATSKEWIQISFEQDTVVSAIETQGRDDHGLGMEFAESYRVEYWRPSLHHWARYQTPAGEEVLHGNVDTRSSELRVLEGGIVVRRIRIVPVSKRTRTVCMRLEIHGCPFKGNLNSYAIPDGSFADGLKMLDSSYDGVKNNGILSGGLGKLYDGSVGADDFESKPSKWVGWRKQENNEGRVVMNFTFTEQRNFSAILLHTNNHFKLHAQAFSQAELRFSNDGEHFSSRVVTFKYLPDRKFDTARWIRIPVPDRIAKFVQVRLQFAPSSNWLLISEVKFESDRVAFEFFEESSDEMAEIELNHSNSITYYAVDDSENQSSLSLFVSILTIFLILLIVACGCWQCYGKRSAARVKSSPSPTFNAKNTQIHLMIDGSTIKHVSPSTYQMNEDNLQNALMEKFPLSDCGSEYADPDMSMSTDCSTQPLLRSYNNPMAESVHYASSNLCKGSPFNTLSSPLSSRSKYAEYGEVYSTNLPEIETSKLTKIEKLGDGEFGEVQLCRLEQRLVAVKTLNNASPDEEYAFQREMRVLGSLKHTNVVEVIGVCTRDRPICCVMEYMQNGDLKSYMAKMQRIDTSVALSLATGLAAGLSYLESRGYVHRDIAARSCLVDHEGNAKIADFGMARSLYSGDYYKTDGHALPIRWMSWEAVLLNKFSISSDIWAFAVTVWEIMGACRDKPFANLTDEQVMENLQHCGHTGQLKKYLPLPALCPPLLYSQVLMKCWIGEPTHRPSFQQLHLHLQTLMHTYVTA